MRGKPGEARQAGFRQAARRRRARELSARPTPPAGFPADGREEVTLNATPADIVGLCARCRHARVIVTPRSRFWLCGRARTDPGYARYPRLPVLACPGYEPLPEGEAPPEGPPRE